MKNIFLALTVLFLCKEYSAHSQIITNGNISQEKIFVHHNTSFLLTGEHLLYKVYCFNTETNNLTNFSKIAYVELVGSNKILISKHKIILKNGMGQGDFFIPTSVASGNYKIIAYTQWMRNSEIDNFYQNDISIINPFQENQKEIIQDTELLKTEETEPKISTTNNSITKINKSKLIDLKVNAKTFSNREKVTLSIIGLKNNLSHGNYSISVREIDTLKIPLRNTANIILNSNPQTSLANKTITYLPELRGELFSGKVLLKENQKPVHNAKVALSISGENYIFKIANTNQKGIFYFNIGEEYDNNNATIQILHNESDRFELTMHQQSPLNYDNLKFFNFKITPETEELILNHSINIQIENAYSSEKPDSIKSIPYITPFFNNKAKSYLLNDYTRFKTLKETFTEIISEIYTRERKEKFTFHVRVHDQEIETGLLPLVIIDGNLVQNQNELLNFNTHKIKKISVVNEMYIYGSQIFEGIISINTLEGDYKNILSNSSIKNIELSKPLTNKRYFNQVYDDSSKLNRIPDFRSQLLWKPNFNLSTEKSIITFYTSDNTGDYEIYLEGFTKNGKPVSIRKIISVE